MIGIIDYDAGNIFSLSNSLTKIGQEFFIIKSSADFAKANKIILPGVGNASFAMQKLRDRNLIDSIISTKIPFLGICLGMQLLTGFSEEGNTDCLGIIQGSMVVKFKNSVKVPQIGWNKVFCENESTLFDGISDGSYFYYVNSFCIKNTDFVTAESEYGVSFAAAVKKDNFYGVQFHPEKSGEDGLKLLLNFCEKC
jgi:glutamine amidotransferase